MSLETPQSEGYCQFLPEMVNHAYKIEDHLTLSPVLVITLINAPHSHCTSNLAYLISTLLRNEVNRKLSVLDIVSCMEWNATTSLAFMSNELSNFGLHCLPIDRVLVDVLRKCTDPAIIAVFALAVGRGVSRTGWYCLPQVSSHVCSHALPH
jgi:hypothetical protein